MGYICKSAQEEALKEIARQMDLSNYIAALRDLRYVGGISKEDYIDLLKKLCNIRD